MLETRNRVEINEKTFLQLMHDLSLAGANTPAANGTGWIGTHPEYGDIEVAKIENPPGHAYRHPSVGFFLTANSGVTTRLTREADGTTPAPERVA